MTGGETVLRIIGIGMGPQHVTPEAAAALRGCDYVLAASKRSGDPLLEVRRRICAEYGVELVPVADPERDRDAPADYPGAVADWHAARVAAYAEVLRARPGTVGMLVWGDPGLYDSTIRIADELDVSYDVVPGVGAPQLLAARHRIVLHPVGRPVHVTTGRRLREAVAAGQENLVVMLNRDRWLDDLDGLEDWSIWWGANLGAPGEQLVAGRVGGVRDDLASARARARAVDGWVMDIYVLRAPSGAA